MKGLYRVFLVSLWFSIMIGCADDSNTSPEAPPLPDRPTHLSGESWMSYSRDDIINRRLNDIAIPGTHDSGTYGITADSSAADDKKGLSVVMKWIDDMENKWYGPVLDSFGVLQAVDDAGKEITSWWARTQRDDFSTQLLNGIRYFDLRVQQRHTSSFYCVHSLLGANLDDLLDGIDSFYRLPDAGLEILILDFQHTFDMDHNAFVDMLKTRLRDKNGSSLIIPRGTNLHLKSLWETSRRILVFYDDEATVAKHPELWYSSSVRTGSQILSPWPNTDKAHVLYKFLGEGLNNTIDRYRKSGKLTVLQALATENSKDVALSIEQHVFNLFNHVPILGHILRKLGFGHVGPMNFFDFNFGGGTLADRLNDPSYKELAAYRANIIIIDDYSHFYYIKDNGEAGDYIDLVCELNATRNAPRPYSGSVTYQTANFTADHYKSYPMEIRFVNTGERTWDPPGPDVTDGGVYLGTAAPYDRITHLYTDDGNWVSQTRIRMQNTSPVRPGEEAVFKFSVTPDDYYESSFQTFELVAYPEGGAKTWFGGCHGNTDIHILTDKLYYGSHLKSRSPGVTVPQFDGTNLSVTFTNTGNMPWFPDVVFLGTKTGGTIDSTYWYTNDGNWVSKSRIRMQNMVPVMPGEDAVFDLTATAAFGAYPWLMLELVADKAAGVVPAGWFGSQGDATWHLPLIFPWDAGSLTGELVDKSPDCTIRRGDSQTLRFVFRNTGKITWYPDMAYLDYVPPGSGAAGLFTDDGNWFTVNKISLKDMVPVKPGEEGTFEFLATPDSHAETGDYGFHIRMDIWFVAGWDVKGTEETIRITVTE